MDEGILSGGLTELNKNIKRLADTVAPGIDSRIFTEVKAFKVYSVAGRQCIKGVSAFDPVRLSELRGIDEILLRLRENISQFIAGLPCNNVLLYGPRGTGKSSAIKSLLNEYAEKGLRIIEVERDTLAHIFDIAEIIRSRPEKFIVFCDDLAFEEEESSYRRLKAVLEGGIEVKPENMLICATSNRRHLMLERMEDNLPVHKDSELHAADTMEEKLSLSDRFGLRLGFYNFSNNTYLDIVRNYAALRKISVPAEELEHEAMIWSLEHGSSYSGRTARQFMDDLEGRMKVR
jgi:uncharacterized protein